MSSFSFLDSPKVSTIAGVGSNLLSNVFSAFGVNSTNKANFRINQMNNAFNERMMQKQMDYNTLMWEKNNEYNDPSAQVERLRNAGINPAFALGSISPGQATSVGSTSAASASPSAAQQAFTPNFQGIPEAILMSKQGEMLDAQIHQQITDNQTRAFKNMQEIADAIATTNNKKIQAKLQQVQLSYADEVQMEQLRNQRATTDKILRETLLLDKNLSIFDEQTRLAFAQQSANILLTNAQQRKTKQETIHEIQKMIETTARIRGIKISNDVARRTADSLVNKAYSESYSSMNPFGFLLHYLDKD